MNSSTPASIPRAYAFDVSTSSATFGGETFLLLARAFGMRDRYASRRIASIRQNPFGDTRQQCADFIATAQNALDVKDSLAFIRHPGWTWHGDPR